MTFVDAPESQVVAGIAQAEITPPVGIYHRMWGAASHDRSTGVHRPLTATALRLAPINGGAPAKVLFAVDHCLLWKPEMEAMLDRIARRSGLAREQLTVFFSHTHGSGLLGAERAGLPGGDLIEPYLERLAETMADLAVQAAESARPAVITYGFGHCGLATNRDFWDADRKRFVCGYNPAGVADREVVTGRIAALDDERTLGVIVNYACHPTTLAWENTRISPDYVGAMRETIERAAGAPCFFIQGASGDVGPRHGFVGDLEIADRNGRQLGYAALSALEGTPKPASWFQYSGPVVSGATLGRWDYAPLPDHRIAETRIWREQAVATDLPYRSDLPQLDETLRTKARWQAAEADARTSGDDAKAADARAMVERADRLLTRIARLPAGDSYPYRAAIWRMGDAVWLPLEGEHYNALQRALRRSFPNLAIIVGTVANGSNVWYLPDQESYGKGLYQEEVSIVAQGGLETLTEALSRGISALTDQTS